MIDAVRADHLVVSFSDEGFVTRREMEEMLGRRGQVVVFSVDYKRYVGAQIGIHSPKGEKVGKVSHLRNTEHIYVATSSSAVADRLQALGGRLGQGAADGS